MLLLATAAALPFSILWAWDGRLGSSLGVSAAHSTTFSTYAIAWLAGGLGGNTFSLKWLYHALAKGTWHRDRLLWRVSTPLISAALALALTAFVRSGLLPILNPNALSTGSGTLAFAFLVGYFSDHAIGALLRFAQRVFGETHRDNVRRSNNDGKPDGESTIRK